MATDNPAPAPPAHHPATTAAAPPGPELGRPRNARDIARRDTESAAPGAALASYPGRDPALSPRHRTPPLGRQIHARQDRQASHSQEHQGTRPAAGPREPRLGGTAGSTVSSPAGREAGIAADGLERCQDPHQRDRSVGLKMPYRARQSRRGGCRVRRSLSPPLAIPATQRRQPCHPHPALLASRPRPTVPLTVRPLPAARPASCRCQCGPRPRYWAPVAGIPPSWKWSAVPAECWRAA